MVALAGDLDSSTGLQIDGAVVLLDAQPFDLDGLDQPHRHRFAQSEDAVDHVGKPGRGCYETNAGAFRGFRGLWGRRRKGLREHLDLLGHHPWAPYSQMNVLWPRQREKVRRGYSQCMEDINLLQAQIWSLQSNLENFGGDEEDYDHLDSLVKQLNALKEANRRPVTAEQREIAMEAGMLHGISAYNEAMGY